MESLAYDNYTTYSDSSAPRTPSPNSFEPMPTSFQPSFKHDILQVQNIQYDQPPYDDMRPESHHGVNASVWAHSSPFASASPDMQNGSMLRELYSEPDLEQSMQTSAAHAQSHYAQYQNPTTSDWALQQQQQQQYQHQPIHSQRSEFTSAPRRATFPYVRQDMESGPYHTPQASYLPEPMISPYGSRVEPLYNDQVALEERYQPGHQPGPVYLSPHTGEAHRIKIEEAVPHPGGYYHGPVHSRPSSSHGMDCMNGAGLPFVSPHTGLPVQHTDDAASKETQYLRRRCFNCHTTEPPSWRRSTLNPGKIVCNKCGLYERTHLRARPLRFDELRAGNKGRKNSIVKGPVGATGPSVPGAPPPVPVPSETSPKQSVGKVKKEPREYPLNRRASVSSTTSVHSATSDWDDNVSVYSNGSGSASGVNSPSMPTGSPAMHARSTSGSPPLATNTMPSPPPNQIRIPAAPQMPRFEEVPGVSGWSEAVTAN